MSKPAEALKLDQKNTPRLLAPRAQKKTVGDNLAPRLIHQVLRDAGLTNEAEVKKQVLDDNGTQARQSIIIEKRVLPSAPRAKPKLVVVPTIPNIDSSAKAENDNAKPILRAPRAPRLAQFNQSEKPSPIQRRDTELSFGISRQPAPLPYHLRNHAQQSQKTEEGNDTLEADPIQDTPTNGEVQKVTEVLKAVTQQTTAPQPLDEFSQKSIDTAHEVQEKLNIRNQELRQALQIIEQFPQKIAEEKRLFTEAYKNRKWHEHLKAKWQAWRKNQPDQYTPPDLTTETQKVAPSFSTQEIQILVKNHTLIKNTASLYNAFLKEAQLVQNQKGQTVPMYMMSLVGQGGMAQVHEIFLADQNGQLHQGVIKNPLIENYPGYIAGKISAEEYKQKCAEVDARNYGRSLAYNTEAYNVNAYLQTPIPHVIKPLGLVTTAQGEQMITYEKITGPNNRTQDFENPDYNNDILPSDKFKRFVSAARGLSNLHARGLVHLDFKPNNVVVGPDGNGIVIDPGSMFHKSDDITIKLENGSASICKKFPNGAEVQLGYTPPYTDLSLVKKAIEKGKSWEVIDRMALGMSLLSMLEDSGFYNLSKRFIREKDHAPWSAEQALYYSPIQQRFALDLNSYPPPSIHRLYQVAAQLIDIEAETTAIPLDIIANEIEHISKTFEKEVDPLYLKYKQTIRNDQKEELEESATLNLLP